jgi:hypothetical protein
MTILYMNDRPEHPEVGQGWFYHQEASEDPLQVPGKEGT